jgi:hypothetical protein
LKITDYLAIYAAILSTLVFVWNVFQSKPKIKVDLIFGLDGKGDQLRSGIYIFARNLSSHDVHLANFSILYPYRDVGLKERLIHVWKYKHMPRRIGWVTSSLSNYSIEDGCPICLEARKSHSVFIPDAALEAMLADATHRSLIGCVQDQLWHNAYSRAFKYPKPKHKGDA